MEFFKKNFEFFWKFSIFQKKFFKNFSKNFQKFFNLIFSGFGFFLSFWEV